MGKLFALLSWLLLIIQSYLQLGELCLSVKSRVYVVFYACSRTLQIPLEPIEVEMLQAKPKKHEHVEKMRKRNDQKWKARCWGGKKILKIHSLPLLRLFFYGFLAADYVVELACRDMWCVESENTHTHSFSRSSDLSFYLQFNRYGKIVFRQRTNV